MVCNVHFFMIFPKELTRIFFLRASLVGDHFLYSLDLYVEFQGWDGKEKSNASHWRVKGLINALSNKPVTKTKITILLGSLQCKRLIRVSYRYKLAIVYPIGHVWFVVKVDSGGRRGGPLAVRIYQFYMEPFIKTKRNINKIDMVQHRAARFV